MGKKETEEGVRDHSAIGGESRVAVSHEDPEKIRENQK